MGVLFLITPTYYAKIMMLLLRRFYVPIMSQSKYSKDFKQEVLINQYDSLYRSLEKETYLNEFVNVPYVLDLPNGEVDFGFKKVSKRDNTKTLDLRRLVASSKYLDCASRLVESQRRKKARIKQKTEGLVLTGYSLFITLTFTDEVFKKYPDPLKRRRLVQRYLKENCSHYVANIDFGGKNGREHYHALVDSSLDFKKWHKFGAINVRHIHANESSTNKVPQYIAKLTNHAIKNKAFDIRLIYSRKPKKK